MRKCFVCENRLNSKYNNVNGHDIFSCGVCGSAQIDEEPSVEDYSEYGDFLTDNGLGYVSNRIKPKLRKRFVFKMLLAAKGASMRMVDFGGGAGYLARSARNCGVRHVSLVEPSKLLRGFAVDSVGLADTEVIESLNSVDSRSIDVIFMMDVIEHIPHSAQAKIMGEVSRVLKSDGWLIGKTPNIRSLNISISGDRDPVVAPPNHCVYFSSRSLKQHFCNHGFYQAHLCTFGFSQKIFRKFKFTPTWIERPSSMLQILISRVLRALFIMFGVFVGVGGRGYSIFFIARKS